jgi:hypothetical protein
MNQYSQHLPFAPEVAEPPSSPRVSKILSKTKLFWASRSWKANKRISTIYWKAINRHNKHKRYFTYTTIWRDNQDCEGKGWGPIIGENPDQNSLWIEKELEWGPEDLEGDEIEPWWVRSAQRAYRRQGWS